MQSDQKTGEDGNEEKYPPNMEAKYMIPGQRQISASKIRIEERPRN